MLGKNLIQAAAGNAGAAGGLGMEDFFSTWLYTGNGSTQTITNGIDLAGEGGMVWIKARSSAEIHNLYDTVRGANKLIYTNGTAAQLTRTDALTSFTSSGFTLGVDGNFEINTNNTTYVSWTFRKAPGFFDVTTATQTTGNTGWLTFNHNLGSIPGAIIIKVTNNPDNWWVYHRSTSSNALLLNSTGAASATVVCQNVTSSSFEFNLTALGAGPGATYVAYLFAHDEAIFGEGGDQSVIKCGSYTGTGAAGNPIDLGWEPQWLLLKPSSSAGNWYIFDNMRGIVTGGNDNYLFPNLGSAESTNDIVSLTPTGFQFAAAGLNGSSATYIYIAIRRGPMKTPTSGTEVFDAVTYTGDGTTSRTIAAGFPVDLTLHANTDRTWNANNYALARITNTFLNPNTTGAESAYGTAFSFTSSGANTGVFLGSTLFNGSSKPFVNHFFRRAPGFFDVVAYTGTGVARTVSHNLGVAPELMIVKQRSATRFWVVYSNSLGAGYYLTLHQSDSAVGPGVVVWNSTNPTTSVFSLGSGSDVNASAGTYIAYLFATLPGISKVGSYTGTGTTQQINCGFTSGARFVLIKRTDSTGDWYVFDTARGIVSGNDPYLLLNSTAAEVTSTDYIDPYSAGFEISSTAPAAINASGGSYIYFSVA